MKITLETVEQVAKLARLGLNESEKRLMAEQLSAILDYADQLQKLDTSNVEPMAHPLKAYTPYREDAAKPFQDVEAILLNGPKREKDFFEVPKIGD